MATMEIKVPDLGGYRNVPVIELLVKPGDEVKKDQGLLTLESDKATLEVPSPAAGIVKVLKVKLGDAVSEGSVIATLEVSEKAPTAVATAPSAENKAALASARFDLECQVVVIGAGPGGYTAAFRAADLGLQTVLIERYADLGGVCLNVGCIPSKALLHAARVLEEAAHLGESGIAFGKPNIDLDKLRGHKDRVIGQLTSGLAQMAKQRKVTRVTGAAAFVGPHELVIETSEGAKRLRFEKAIIAAGSEAVKLPAFPWEDPRVMDSTDALRLADAPKRLLVVGGGIIGLEMACVYHALGSKVTVVELADQLIPGADADLVKPLASRLARAYEGIHLRTKVAKVEARADGLLATFEGGADLRPDRFDRVLCAVGRAPNGKKIQAQKAGVAVDDRGFIAVDKQMRTNVPHIFAIGDVIGQPMLAHKATHEGKVAAEVAAGHATEALFRVIPSVAYTDPEIAWVGITEQEAKKNGIAYEIAKFPHAASGRAIGIGRTEGFTKLLFDPNGKKLIGAGIVGPSAGDLISEAALAIEMGCEAQDLALTVHPHPTLSESIAMAAEIYEGTITDLFLPKRK